MLLSWPQVSFIGSGIVGSQLKGFELRQLSAGTQLSYTVEYLDPNATNGKFVRMLSPCSLKNTYH